MLQQLAPSMIRKEPKKRAQVDLFGLDRSKYPIGVLEMCTTSRERFQRPRRGGFTLTTIPHSYFGIMRRRSLLIIGGQGSFHGQWPLTSPCFTLSRPGWHQTHSTNMSNHYAREYSTSKPKKRVAG